MKYNAWILIVFLKSRFKHSLMTFGDKFTSAEVDNAYGEFSIEDGMIDAIQLKGEKYNW